MRRNNRSTGLLTIMLLVGAVLGGTIGQLFANYLPFLALGHRIGFGPTAIRLGVLEVTLGFGLQFTVAGGLGLLAGYLMYRNLR